MKKFPSRYTLFFFLLLTGLLLSDFAGCSQGSSQKEQSPIEIPKTESSTKADSGITAEKAHESAPEEALLHEPLKTPEEPTGTEPLPESELVQEAPTTIERTPEFSDTPPSNCPAFVPGNDPKFASLKKQISSRLSSSVSSSAPSGAAVAIVLNGKLLSVAGLGSRAKTGYPEAGKKVDKDTLFGIASTSKWVTAAGAMALVQQGKLDLKKPVTTYLPDYTETNGQQNDITVDNLLKMISGLNNDGGCYIFSQSASKQPRGCAAMTQPTPEHVLENMFSKKTLQTPPWSHYFNKTANGKPGKAPWKYSNWGIMLAGRVMEVTSKHRFAKWIKNSVFAAASMCTATFSSKDMVSTQNYAIGSGRAAADGHCPEPELGNDCRAPWLPNELACPGRNPNGGVRASATDLGRFAAFLLGELKGNNRLFSQKIAQQMLTPLTGRAKILGSIYGDSYGYCNFHHVYQGYHIYSHGGGRPGFGTLFWIIPSENFAVAIINNNGSTNYFKTEMEYAVRCYLKGQCTP